jgi:hypothetical protein
MRAFAVLLLYFASLQAQEPASPTFGTTVVRPGGLEGQIYAVREGIERLPDFTKLRPVGSVYTDSLNIPWHDFNEGFPGVTDRLEWFGIEYTGRFWIEKPGAYVFVLTSDDGARLWIDDRLVVDNDGLHAEQIAFGRVNLRGGIHRMRLGYFQGPRYHVALRLRVAGADEPLRVFSTQEFKPPPNPADWKYPEVEKPPEEKKEPRRRITIFGR